MKLILVQHGKSVGEEVDPQRPLSEAGRAETTRIARIVAESGLVKVSAIFHSGKLRARQTAEIFKKSLKPERGMIEAYGISPKDNSDKMLELLTREKEDIMIVGHLPHLGRAAAKLVMGDEEARIVAFKYSGPVCFEMQPDGTWTVIPLLSF